MPCVTGQGSLVGFLLVAFCICEWPPKETAPARGQAGAEVEAGMPHIGTIAMWVSYPADPIKFFFRDPRVAGFLKRALTRRGSH
jgi:hypothetical protein